MTKFVLITVGFEKPTPEIMEKWMHWFQSIGDKIVEQVGLVNGKEITPEGTYELEMNREALTGYLVIDVDSPQEAERIAKECPMITSTLVYQAMERKE